MRSALCVGALLVVQESLWFKLYIRTIWRLFSHSICFYIAVF